tara:strand:- start:477 stop:1166 length:690 start_codon:yes stop_codon:yes gene_type:complete
MSPQKKLYIKHKKFTAKQNKFLDIAFDQNSKIIFVNGPAGSTKTFMSVYAALKEMDKDDSLDIIYVRTVIESAEKGLGFLPGDMEDKLNPYMSPLKDKLDELLPIKSSPTAQKQLIENGRVQAMPINYLRGASWSNKIIVADEAQNFTFKELTTLITRLGENSKLFICGDPMQSDIGPRSGFIDMYNTFNDQESQQNGIQCFVFSENDIKRSRILKYIIKKLKSKKQSV